MPARSSSSPRSAHLGGARERVNNGPGRSAIAAECPLCGASLSVEATPTVRGGRYKAECPECGVTATVTESGHVATFRAHPGERLTVRRVNPPLQWRTAQIEMSTTRAWPESDLRDAGDGPGYYSTYLGTTRNERTRVSRYGKFPSEAAAKSVHSNLTRLDPHATIKYVQPAVKNPAIDDVKKQIEDAIRAGMSRYLWISAFASWAEEADLIQDVGAVADVRGTSGIEWDDVAPETPPAAIKAADDLIALFAAGERLTGATPMTELFELAMTVDQGEPFSYLNGGWGLIHDLWVGRGKQRKREAMSIDDVANDFGAMMAAESLGQGVAWSDDHVVTDARGTDFDPSVPRFECYYDGQVLEWNGATRDGGEHAQRVHRHDDAPKWARFGASDDGDEVGHPRIGSITIVNPRAKHGKRKTPSFVLWFSTGGMSATHLLVYADNLDDALGECVDYLEEQGLEGFFADDEVAEAYSTLIAEGVDEDEAREEAEVDTLAAGNHGRYLRTGTWGVTAENPSPAQLREIGGVA